MLITEEYRKQQMELHAKGNYGTAALQLGDKVNALLEALQINSLLDYGCGSKRSLLKVLESDRDILYQGYDPGVPAFSGKAPADLVTCIDVLEHIEPELLGNVLDDLQSLSPAWAFFTIHTGPAAKILSDGRNAHLIQEPPAWWLPKLLERWELQTFSAVPNGFHVLLRAQ